MKVTLIGAGPGGIGLLTLRGLEALQAADVVLYDRFVSDDILAAIPGSAEKLDVGKRAGSHPVPQGTINKLLLENALRGKNVVRLKGGDPFVFARGAEELELLAENNIPFEVVPGVTSAVAAAAYAGIPITHRDCASSFHVITAHAKNNEPPNIDFGALVKLNGTLVFLMGAAAIGGICESCAAAGMDKDMPAAVVENAATSSQRKFLGTITTLPQIARANNVEPPAVVVVGKVCKFSGRYDWFERKPLRNKRVVVVAPIKYEALNTVKQKSTPKLSGALRELGCDVIEIPCLTTAPLTGNDDALAKRLKHINGYSWLVFTSGVGVNIFFDELKKALIDIRELSRLKIACVGAETEKEANKRGIMADYVPDEYNGAALARGLAKLVKKGEKLFIARAKGGDKGLTGILTEAGISFDDVPVYETVRNTKSASAAIAAIAGNAFDLAAFTSPSAVERFAETAAHIGLGKIKAVCIGEKTAAAARARGMEAYVPTEATVWGMVEKIKELCARGTEN